MKQLFSITVLLTLVSFATPVAAEELKVRAGANTTPVNVRAEVKAKIEQHLASTTEGTSSRREMMGSSTVRAVAKASSTEKRVMIQQSVAKRLAEHTARVLSATVDRLEKILNRIESRMAKVKANGGVTADAEKAVADAKAHIAAARDSIAVFASIDLSGTNFQENFSKVRDQAQIVKMHLKEIHTDLMNAVRNLKGAGGDENKNGTSTNATSTISATTSTEIDN